MKKVFNSFFVIIAAMVTFAGCQKEENNAPAAQTKTVEFFAESIETKTHFGDKADGKYPTFWDESDKVKVFVNFQSAAKTEATEKVRLSDDEGRSASFSVDLNQPAADSYTFYAIAPGAAFVNSSRDAEAEKFSINIETTQNSEPTSVDKDSQVIFSKAECGAKWPTEPLYMGFSHLTAYGKFSLANLTNKVKQVNSVSIEFPTPVVGKFDCQDGVLSATDDSKNEITIIPNESGVYWFACAPAIVGDKTATVKLNTDQGILQKEITFGEGASFKPGVVVTFALDMKDVEPSGDELKYYEKVTSAPEDWSGTYLMVCESKKMLLSSISTTSTKYGIGSSVTITDNNKILATADNEEYQVVISKALNENAYKMAFAKSYLYWTSGNSLATNSTVTDKTSWKISLLSDGNVKIQNCSDDTRVIGWNASSPRFACYTSAQTAIQLYKLEGESEGGDTPVEPKPVITFVAPAEMAAAGGEGSFTFDVTNPVEGESVTVTEELDWISDVDVDGNTVSYTITENTSEDIRTGVITLSYEGAESVEVTITQAGVEVETEEPQVVTIADFLAADKSDVIYYQLTGVITDVASAVYGNITIKDDSASVYIYGLTTEKKTTNDKSFSSIGLKVGDQVTLVTVRGEYNGTAQGGGTNTPAYYVGHIPSCVAPTISCVENIVTIKAEAGATVYYTTNGSVPTQSSNIYKDPFDITSTVTVKAIAVAPEKMQSSVAEQSCTYVDPNAGGEEPEQPTEKAWTLVTDASTLKTGDQIVIVAKNVNYAMSTTQNNNNRAHAAVTKNGNNVTFDSAVQILTLKAGTASGSYAFYTGSGYLYAASTSSNHLKTQTTLKANGSWNISITSAGVATIKSVGNTSKGWLRYNATNNPPIFSCYGSGQTDVCIYKFQ